MTADESSDEGNRNQFAIIARFWYNQKVSDVYLGIIRITSATAENLMKAIEQFLLVKGILIDRTVMVGFDGCNTMSGETKGIVNTLLSKLYKLLFTLHYKQKLYYK